MISLFVFLCDENLPSHEVNLACPRLKETFSVGYTHYKNIWFGINVNYWFFLIFLLIISPATILSVAETKFLKSYNLRFFWQLER